MKIVVVILLLSLVNTNVRLATANSDLVITPFGYRPKDCVFEAPHGATVGASQDGTRLVVKTLATEDLPSQTYYYDVPPHCGDDMHKIREKRIARKEKKMPTINDGWLDYVGWYPPSDESNLSSFNSTYVVPGDPEDTTDSQTLYYFIGMQDNDSPDSVNILQPVLTWGGGTDSWYVQSWICCPSNISTSSPILSGLSAGSTLQGVILRESESNWKVDSIFDGQHTTLYTDVGDYIYNWADITLEVYGVGDCTDLATGKAYFNDLAMSDSNGDMLDPEWENYTGDTDCGGSIDEDSPTSWYIEHVY